MPAVTLPPVRSKPCCPAFHITPKILPGESLQFRKGPLPSRAEVCRAASCGPEGSAGKSGAARASLGLLTTPLLNSFFLCQGTCTGFLGSHAVSSHESESSHREGAHALDLDRHGKKAEASAGKLVQAS